AAHVACDAGGKVGLVEMIGWDDLDLAAEHLAAEIFRRHLRGHLAAGPGDVGVEAGHVEDAAKFERRLALRESCGRGNGQHRGENPGKNSFHRSLPVDAAIALAAINSVLSIMPQPPPSGKEPWGAATHAVLHFPQSGMPASAMLATDPLSAKARGL